MDYANTALSFAVSLIAAIIAGLIAIPALRRAKLGQHIREVGPTWHKTKEGTPTMGGIIFIVSVSAAMLLLILPVGGREMALCVLFLSLACAIIGILDDYEKIAKKQNLGLTAAQKLILQAAVTAVFLALLRVLNIFHGEIAIPFTNISWTPHWAVSYAFYTVLTVGMINAVNLTDGIDGLNTGVTIPVAGFYLYAALGLGAAFEGVSMLSAALLGGLLGFLVFNFNPAKVFMGDTGSLFLGGMVTGLAFVLGMPLMMLLIGVVYLAEAVSVMLQVMYFKATKGKRLFKMSPIHHHFEMCGWKEKKIFLVFTLITAAACGICAYFM